MKLYGVLGAGGFGREVMPLAETMLRILLPSEKYQLVFIVEQKNSNELNHYPVLSLDEFLTHDAAEKFFNIAIANSHARKRLAELMLQMGVAPFQITASHHVNLYGNHIEEGAIFCPFTTVTANAKIGKFFHANIYSYVAHDCVIGDYVTFAPNVHCNGNVIIEDGVYVGTGVIIREGLPDRPMIIGKGAVLGMGAVVTKSVPAFETVVGNPARAIRRNTAVTAVSEQQITSANCQT